MNKKNIFVFIIFVSLLFVASCQDNSNTHQLDARKMMAYLVDDNKLGRATGSEPMTEIQDWLIKQFKDIGVKPLPGVSSYRQDFTAKSRKKGDLPASNIIGYLDCNCETNKYFIIGAHYDHVGVNPELEGDQIFNGADDDASGVVASLIIANELAKSRKLPFNVVIAAWDAEEIGLQGSQYFVDNPLVSLKDIEGGFMFELVGSKGTKNIAWMTGFEFSSLYPLMQKHLAKEQWTLKQDPFPQQMLFTRSDNKPFAMMDLTREKVKTLQQGMPVDITGVPVHAISIWEGQNHYHQVNDHLSVIDFENLTNFSIAVANAIKSIPEGTEIEWLDNKNFNFKRPN